MSAIEDTRKVVQDFPAPELRTISARLDALEKRFEAEAHHADSRHADLVKRFDGTDRRGDRMEDKTGRIDDKTNLIEVKTGQIQAKTDRIEAKTDRIEEKTDRIEAKLDKSHQELMQAFLKVVDFASVNERLAKLEAKNAA